jgi:hypothetical protein
MLRTATYLIRRYAVGAALSAHVLQVGWATAAFADDTGPPPLSVPEGGPPQSPGAAIPVGEWLLYPSIRTFSFYSDNVFMSTVNPISSWVFGIDPGLVAEWNDGIHHTTLYGNAELRDYTTDSAELNAFDNRAGFVQRYDPLRDLNFSVQGDYTHQTIATGLISAIPTVTSTPGTTTLPNGNTVLPNGNIVSPTGQIVGTTTPGLNVANSTSVINPFDQYTATVSVQKILNDGVVNLSGAVSHAEYQNTSVTTGLPDYTDKTLNGSGAFWVGPLFYVYSLGSLASYDYTSGGFPASTALRAVGGIGTRQDELFQGSVYFGRQGIAAQSTATQNAYSAGGDVYGGKFAYNPTPVWKVSLALDETINIASQGAAASNLAQVLPTASPIIVPVSSSTKTTIATLQSAYQISTQWSTAGTFGYARVYYLDPPQLSQGWLADAVLKYQMTRQLALSWEYQYAVIVSTIPFSSARRNYFMMDATYKF